MSTVDVAVVASLAALSVAASVPPRRAPPRPVRDWPGSSASSDTQGSRRPVDAVHRFRLVLAAVAGFGVALMVGGLTGAVLGVFAGLFSWRTVGRMEPRVAKRRREQLSGQLPHVVDLMAASLSVGASPVSAVEMVSRAVDTPMSEELGAVSNRLALGVEPVRVWAEVSTHPQIGPLGRCLVRANDSGASVAEAMHRLAEDLRHANRAAVESRARSVGVRAAAPLGICLLPAFVLIGVVPLVAGSVSVLMAR
jgi:Flp pilus assembly protein TadB